MEAIWLRLLRAFLTDEVLPYVRAEERTLYPVARRDPRAGLLLPALERSGADLAALLAREDHLAGTR